jgi:hypothetical protein
VIEAALLLAAIELNGALVSRGAMVFLNDTQCAVEFSAIAPSLSENAKKQRQGDYWIGTPEQCSYNEHETRLNVRLPQSDLATKTLTLSESSGAFSIALLHDSSLLAEQADFASQPPPRPIPSAAFDLFAGSGLRTLGATLSLGPWSLQALRQETRSEPASQRLTLDYLFQEGAHFKAGDFRTEFGVEQRFGEFRGLLFTNRAAPLRGDGKAQAQLAIENPSRVQFFDRNGIPIYSSEILPPGNYQVQGYGASTIPGFLEARLVDVNGVVQSVALPWSADRRILSVHEFEWELFSGQARAGQNMQNPETTSAARLRYGVTQHLTAGLHTDQQGAHTRWAIEASTRAIPSMITTAAAGYACDTAQCAPTWLLETRADLRKNAFLIANLARTVVGAPLAKTVHTAQLSLSGAWSARWSGSLYLASEWPENAPAQHSQTVSASLRLTPSASLQFQARHQLFANEGSAWVGSLGLTVNFASLHTSAGGSLQQRSRNNGQGSSTDYTVQISRNTPTAYGPQISLAHTQGQTTRSDAFGRYASRFGDVSARTDSLSSRLDWSASTRLWITPEAITLAPTGEHNLVIHQLGIPAVKIQHAGTETQETNANGTALFRKSPAWTDSRYLIDSKTVPFGINLSIGTVKIPLAMHRAYLVDYRPLWSASQSWQIANAHELGDPQDLGLRDRHGNTVYFTSDGYVDLQSSDQLPLTALRRQGQPLNCERLSVQQSVTQLYCHGTTL